jgi:hypothetical protein
MYGHNIQGMDVMPLPAEPPPVEDERGEAGRWLASPRLFFSQAIPSEETTHIPPFFNRDPERAGHGEGGAGREAGAGGYVLCVLRSKTRKPTKTAGRPFSWAAQGIEAEFLNPAGVEELERIARSPAEPGMRPTCARYAAYSQPGVVTVFHAGIPRAPCLLRRLCYATVLGIPA